MVDRGGTRETNRRASENGAANKRDRSGEVAGRRWGRRQYLGLVGAAAAVSFAGCSEVTDHEFTANQIYLPGSSAESLGYEETVLDEVVVEEERSVSGVDVRATVTNYIAGYEESEGSQNGQLPEDVSVMEALLGPSGGVAVPANMLGMTGGPATFIGSGGGAGSGKAVIDPNQTAVLVPEETYLSEGGTAAGDAGVPLVVTGRPELEPVIPLPGGETSIDLPDERTERLALLDGRRPVGRLDEHTWPTRYEPQLDGYLFPGDHWFPGDTFDDVQVAFFPGDAFDDVEAFFPGDAFEPEQWGAEPFSAGETIEADVIVAPPPVFTPTVDISARPEIPIEEADVGRLDETTAGMMMMIGEDGDIAPVAAFPGCHLFPSETFTITQSAALVPLDELYPGDMWDEQHALFFVEEEAVGRLEGVRVLEPGSAVQAEGTMVFFPGDSWFPGDTWFPGDSWFPSETFDDDFVQPGDTRIFPGDAFVQPGDTRIFPGDAFAEFQLGAGFTAATEFSEAFPGDAFFPGDSFTPVGAIHYSLSWGSSADVMPQVGEFLPAYVNSAADATGVSWGAMAMQHGDAAIGIEASSTTIGGVSTPTASVMGQSLNPVANMSPSELLTDPEARLLLASAGVDGLDGDWFEGPDELASMDAPVANLSGSHQISSYAGLTGSADDPTVVFVHLALAETDADDLVVLAASRSSEVDQIDLEYVGDGGYLRESTFEDDVDHVQDVFESFVYGQ